MTFDEYQSAAKTTAEYPKGELGLYYLGLGLAGESGELVEKLKKVLRNKNGQFDESDKTAIIKEAGDVLWYLSQLSAELGFSFNNVAEHSIAKLKDRQQRGVLKSEGDER